MKLKTLIPLFLVLLIFMHMGVIEASETVVLEYFYTSARGCAPCRASKLLLEKIQREYSRSLIIEWQNTEFQDAMEQFLAYNLSKLPAIVFNYDSSSALYDMREGAIRAKIDYYIALSGDMKGEDDNSPDEGIPNITLPLVILSGLIDGINPCAFSLLVFFLSFLFSIRRGRLNVFWMGLMYITGVFLGYVGLGLSLLRTVILLDFEHLFGLVGVILLFIMGLLQLREATTFGRRLLKFPNFAVPTFKRLTKTGSLPVALLLGFIVSLFEFPCSGGVYIGILILLANRGLFRDGLMYLLLYNVMFVVPLILLLLLSSNIDILLRMDEWRVVSRRRFKFLSGVFLIVMALFIWLLMFVKF